MPATTTFDSTKETLKKLLEKVQEGSIQLPEFQRNWLAIVMQRYNVSDLDGSICDE